MPIKFCKDCSHYLKIENGEFSRCQIAPLAPDNSVFLVTGKIITPPIQKRFNFCSCERKNENGCGPEAKLFNPAFVSTAG